MKLTDLWPGSKGTAYDVRTPIWEQYWVWDAEWMKTALAHNTVPAFVLRGAATVLFQAAILVISGVYGVALALWLMGVTA